MPRSVRTYNVRYGRNSYFWSDCQPPQRACEARLDQQFAEQRLAFVVGLPPPMTSSMHNDLEQGRRLEVDWLSGGVVELGKSVGVPTPFNMAVRDILTLQANGK